MTFWDGGGGLGVFCMHNPHRHSALFSGDALSVRRKEGSASHSVKSAHAWANDNTSIDGNHSIDRGPLYAYTASFTM